MENMAVPTTSSKRMLLIYVCYMVLVFCMYEHMTTGIFTGMLTMNKPKWPERLAANRSDIDPRVPNDIYMLWDKGWKKAPLLNKLCMQSFVRHNPDFRVRALNLSEAEVLINRRQHYSDHVWQRATIQAKSDIIRVELLARYGGIWADATVQCNEPLSKWLNVYNLSKAFLCYQRHRKNVARNNFPFISTWVLVASRDSVMLQLWREEIRKAWATSPLPIYKLGYFWVHRLFRGLVYANTSFGNLYNKVPFHDSTGPHCIGQQNVSQHVYKLSYSNCKYRRRDFLKHYELKTL